MKLITITIFMFVPIHWGYSSIYNTIVDGDIDDPLVWAPSMPSEPFSDNDTILIQNTINFNKNCRVDGVLIVSQTGRLENTNKSLSIGSTGKVEVNGFLAVKSINNDGWLINNSRVEVYGNLINNGTDSHITGLNGVFRLQNKTINNADGYIEGILNFCRFDEVSDPMLSNSGYVDWSTVTVCGPLPVKLLSFKAVSTGNTIQVTWETTEEINHDLFELEKSTDSKEFNFLAAIENSEEAAKSNLYRYIDYENHHEVFYRLKQIDMDGTFVYSDIIRIEIEPEESCTIYPNPSEKGQKVYIQKGGQPLEVVLFNEYGKEIYRKTFEEETMNETLLPEKKTMSSGIYYVQIYMKGGVETQKLIIR